MGDTSAAMRTVKLRSPEYPNDRDVYVVGADGSIRMPGRDLSLSPVLRGEPVAVELCADNTMVVSYGPLKLGTISAQGRFARGSRTPNRDSDDPAAVLNPIAE